MTGFPGAPLAEPGCELQMTLDGGAVLRPDVVAAAAALQGATTVEVAEVLEQLEVGEEAEALDLDLARAPAGAREEKETLGVMR